jgi:hypothetical protein
MWLVEDLQAGILDPHQVTCLTLASWGRRANPEPIKILIETLTEEPDLIPQLTALDLILERPVSEMAYLEPILITLIDRLARHKLSGMSAHVWEQGCNLGLKRGRVKEIIKAATTAIIESSEDAWKVLMEAVKLNPAEVWKEITPCIEMRHTKSYRIVLESQRYGLVSQVPVAVVMDWVGSDTRRSINVACMCSAHERPLNEIARRLIGEFGANSPAAEELASRAHSTPGAVWSIVEFAKSQLENAKNWALDSNPEVARWGKDRVTEFQHFYESESAREEFERKEW